MSDLGQTVPETHEELFSVQVGYRKNTEQTRFVSVKKGWFLVPGQNIRATLHQIVFGRGKAVSQVGNRPIQVARPSA